jgi:hypothetical protein
MKQEFLPIKETDEERKKYFEERADTARAVVRHNVGHMARMIEESRLAAHTSLDLALDAVRRIEKLQEEFHYLLQILEKESLV